MPESLAIDTDLIVRYLTGDHPRQSARARALIDGNDVFVAATVLLETEWVLRSVYAFTTAQVSKALRDFAGLARVTIEDEGAAAQALDWMDAGIDLADALHLAKAGAVSVRSRLNRGSK
jgi:predicted nucleic acid-binding protein